MIGFIGLGIMGYPMASNLAKKGNLKLKVWNRSGAKSDQFVKEHEGCEKAATAREVEEKFPQENFRVNVSDFNFSSVLEIPKISF